MYRRRGGGPLLIDSHADSALHPENGEGRPAAAPLIPHDLPPPKSLTIVRYMDGIPIVRRFNRTVTQRIGALDHHFLGRNRTLGASRVLCEIGPTGIEIRDLRARLGLDSGYTSRLLRSLEKEGLIRLAPSKEDARVRAVALTRAGTAEVATLNRLSDEAAAAILEPLSERQRAQLQGSMIITEKLLRASSVVIEVEDPTSRAASSCVGSYFVELADRFEDGFDPGQSISAEPEELTPPRGYLVLARLYGEAKGCGALKCHSGFGEIKRMWVAPSCRGLGIGRRILLHLEGIARGRGLRILRLETNRALTEAQALYKACGYREVAPFNSEPYAHHWFQKSLPAIRSSPRGTSG